MGLRYLAALALLTAPLAAVAALPAASFQLRAATVVENGASRELVVELSAPSAQTVTVPIVIDGGTALQAEDYAIVDGPLVFAPGETTRSIAFAPTDDGTLEADEFALLSLGTPTNARAGAITHLRVTIADNERPPLGFNAGSPAGTNLAPVTDFTAEYPFANFFKQARFWTSGNKRTFQFDDGRSVIVDAHGYVKQLRKNQVARAILFTGLKRDPDLNGRRFILRFDGSGAFTYQGATRVAHAAHRDVIELPTGGPDDEATLVINLIRTDPADPVRNIRLTPPGGICRFKPQASVAGPGACTHDDFVSFEDAAGAGEIIFNPQFIAGIKTYRVLRFMDWMRTNSSQLVGFGELAEPDDAFWSRDAGVPLEAITALANLLDADPWVNVPHLANDDFARRLATTLREQLEPARRAYVEYSNETWNGIFTQASFVQDRGQALGLDQPENDRFIGGLRFYSKRAQRVFDLFAAAYGTERGKRVRRVMATQAVNNFLTQTILEFDQAAQKCDAFAIAPYFADTITETERAQALVTAGVDGVFGWLTTGTPDLGFGKLADLDAAVASQKGTVASFGIPLITYEGGQHFLAAGPVQFDAQLNALMDAVNRDPRMKDVYLAYLGNWRARSADVFMHYLNADHWSAFGRWGSREFPTQARAQAPKFDALQTYIEEQPLP